MPTIDTAFDFHAYIATLTRSNLLARREGFLPCTCSGLGYLEGMLQQMRTTRAWVCTSDVCDESTARHGGAWFRRRVFTVFIVRRHDPRHDTDHIRQMNTCRELFRQFHTRFIHDEEQLRSRLCYLGVDDVRSRELGGEFLAGATGLYFMIAVDEPVNLCYDPGGWQFSPIGEPQIQGQMGQPTPPNSPYNNYLTHTKMINFYPVPRKNPTNKVVKYYAQPSAVSVVTLDQITDRIEKRSTVSSADAKAVLDALQYEIKEALLAGCSVRLGDLGSFRPTLASRGMTTADEVTSASVKAVRVRFTPSTKLKKWFDINGGEVRIQKAAPADKVIDENPGGSL